MILINLFLYYAMQLKCINMLIEIYSNTTVNQVVIVLGNWLFAESLLLVIELGLGLMIQA